jgi:GMP synthase (glutamine-hydrolysing)
LRILALVHQPDAGPGVFAEAIRGAGAQLDTWLVPRGGSPPGDPFEYGAVITLGGAMHADQDREHPWLVGEKRLLADLVQRQVPLLGVCLGAQLLAEAMGGTARRARTPEIGFYDVSTTDEAGGDPLIGPLAPGFRALQWHSYEFTLPDGAVPLALSETCLQAFRLGEAAWAIQFHAEVTGEDLESWIADYRSDPDAADLDPAALRAQARAAITGWNGLGRGLCERFLAAARSRLR